MFSALALSSSKLRVVPLLFERWVTRVPMPMPMSMPVPVPDVCVDLLVV